MTIENDVRCRRCEALLARFDGGTLVLKRGEVTATVSGTFRADLSCPRCRLVAVVYLANPERKDAVSAKERMTPGLEKGSPCACPGIASKRN